MLWPTAVCHNSPPECRRWAAPSYPFPYCAAIYISWRWWDWFPERVWVTAFGSDWNLTVLFYTAAFSSWSQYCCFSFWFCAFCWCCSVLLLPLLLFFLLPLLMLLLLLLLLQLLILLLYVLMLLFLPLLLVMLRLRLFVRSTAAPVLDTACFTSVSSAAPAARSTAVPSAIIVPSTSAPASQSDVAPSAALSWTTFALALVLIVISLGAWLCSGIVNRYPPKCAV